MSKAEIMQLRAETMLTFMAADIRPALLAALLEDAGARCIEILTNGDEMWLLTVPEDTEE